MAKQDSRDVVIEEEWEEYSGIIEGSVKAILQGLHESCGIIDRDEDVDKNLLSQQLDALQESIADSSGETTCDAKHLTSVASRTFSEDFIQDTRSQMSSDLMSSSDGSKVLCHECSNRSDDTQNLASAGLNLLKSTHEKQNGQKVTYCAECEKPIGSADSILHPTESETPGTYRATIEKILREMSDRESNGRKVLEMMDCQNREFVKKTDTLRNDINSRREELKELVDRHADSLLVEVDSWRDEVSEVQAVERDTLSLYVDSLDSYKASCKEILVDGSVTDIEQVAADLEKKGKELRKIPEDGFHGLFHGFRVSLKKTNIEEFLTDSHNNNSNNIVGVLEEDSDIQDFEQISEEKKIYSFSRYDFPKRISRVEKLRKGSMQRDQNGDRIVYREEPVLVGTLRTHAAEKEDRGILGVAFLDDELFVISRERSEVEVFDCQRFIFSCELDLDCLLNPEDIGSCANRKCLYIMDRKKDRSRSEILKVDTDGKLMKRWSTGGQWGRISVTPESNILLCMYKTRMLNEYTPDGILLRVIQFAPETGLDHPRHAVKLANGQFLVGHGETGDPVHRVVKIDARGKVMGSFPGSSVASDEEVMMMTMRRPFYLAADAEGQCVCVADTDNRRVLMLNSALELSRELLSGERHGLRYPARICIDSSRGLLFVADNKVGDKRILVFLIK